MQETMIHEQEQLLIAIDNIDDVSIMAEAAVIGKLAELYVRQTMIQESLVGETNLEEYFAESSLFQEAREPKTVAGAKIQAGLHKAGETIKGKAAVGFEKLKNFSIKDALSKIWRAIKGVFTVIWAGIKKFFAHFKPSYLKALINVKRSDFAAIAKKYGCKVKVNTDGSMTLMLPFIELSYVTAWVKKTEAGVDKMIKNMERFLDKGKSFKSSFNPKEFKFEKLFDYKYINKMEKLSQDPEASEKYTDKQVKKYGTAGAAVSRGLLKMFPTKLMAVDQFTDIIYGSQKESAITGKVKEKTGVFDAMDGLIKKINTMCGYADSIGNVVSENDAEDRVVDAVNELINASQKLLKHATGVQSFVDQQINASYDLCQEISEQLKSGAGQEDIRARAEKKAWSRSPERTAKNLEKRTKRNDDVRDAVFGTGSKDEEDSE